MDLMKSVTLQAPTLIDYEVANALRGLVLGGALTPTRADQALEDFADIRIERHGLTRALTTILTLRDNFTAYDAAYVVLARALDAPLLTMDSKLLEARRLGIDVEYCAPTH